MFELMLQKILHKKWMVISLIIGNVLLIAIAIANPMYRDAALSSMLQEEFTDYIDEENENPAILDVHATIRKGEDRSEYYAWAEETAAKIGDTLNLDIVSQVTHKALVVSTAVSQMNRNDRIAEVMMKLGTLSDLTSHITLVDGELYSDTLDEEGRIEAVATMTGFVEMNLLIGEEYEFPYFKDADGNPYHVVIVGVITCSDTTDTYWINSPDSYSSEVFISESLFAELIENSGLSVNYDTDWYTQFDYTTLRYSDVSTLYRRTNQLIREGTGYASLYTPDYLELLSDYSEKEQRISITLTILMVPVMVLLCAFLYMISRQLFDMEESEISLLKSRGSSNRQIRELYLLQSAFLAAVGLLLGIPLGALITKAIGSASAFLEFSSRRNLKLAFTWEEVYFTAAAVAVSILMTLLPAIRQSRVSIVGQKRSRARAKKPFFQKFFLDFILLAVSGYGYYNFYRTKDSLVADVMAGKSLDPLLFLSSSLFILGCSLVMLRIIPAIAKLIFALRKKRMKPAAYASFLEIIRSGQKRYFIMTFLMLTVALGIFNTSVARTIEANADKNETYLAGADLRVQEYWSNNLLSYQMGLVDSVTYTEPDFGKYGSLSNVEHLTRVYVDDNAATGNNNSQKATVYGISTKEFGLVTAEAMPNGILEQHYFTYLNELAVGADYVLVSSNFRDILGYEIGDTLVYTTDGNDISATIIDFVEYFPGYEPTHTGLNPDGTTYVQDQYLIVAHLSTIQKETGVLPYEIWIDFKDGNTDSFYTFVQDNDIRLSYVYDLSDALSAIREDPLYEGTNGILTMSFIIVLVLCLVGYLIYWILSIRSRELLFGIFRAMGMSRGEIIGMLVNEQIFASLLPILAGTGIGIGASRLFVPIIQIAYSSTDQVLPLSLITENSDLVRLFAVILVMLIIGLIVLIRQILKMKLNEALKLGED